VVCLGIASAAIAQTDACGDRKVTKKISKDMSAAQEAFNAKNWEEVLVKAALVESNPTPRSVFDDFWLNEFKGVAHTNLKKYPEALVELEAAVSSPCMEEASKPNRYKVLMQLAYSQKQYPKAIEFGNHALESNWDADVAIYVGNAYYIGNDYKNTKRILSEVVAKQEEAGKVPDEQTYRILQGACVNLKDDPCVTEQFEKLVAHYPKPAYWQDLTNTLLRSSSTDKQIERPAPGRRRGHPADIGAVLRDGAARDCRGTAGRSPVHHREGKPEGHLQGSAGKGARDPTAGGSQAGCGARQVHARQTG